MQSSTRNTILSAVALSAALTAVIWLTAGSLATRFDVVNVKYYTFFYQWQTSNPTFMAYLTGWLGYALHNILAWFIIYRVFGISRGVAIYGGWFLAKSHKSPKITPHIWGLPRELPESQKSLTVNRPPI
jgi:hypothetical protein